MLMAKRNASRLTPVSGWVGISRRVIPCAFEHLQQVKVGSRFYCHVLPVYMARKPGLTASMHPEVIIYLPGASDILIGRTLRYCTRISSQPSFKPHRFADNRVFGKSLPIFD
jgi:hypothetical protein